MPVTINKRITPSDSRRYGPGDHVVLLNETGGTTTASICVVLTSSTGRIHAFPDNDPRYAGKTCLDCGAPI